MRRSTRDWIVDVLCILLALGIGLVGYFTMLAEEPALPDWVLAADVVAGLVACGALWLRRRWPVGLALAIDPVRGASPPWPAVRR